MRDDVRQALAIDASLSMEDRTIDIPRRADVRVSLGVSRSCSTG